MNFNKHTVNTYICYYISICPTFHYMFVVDRLCFARGLLHVMYPWLPHIYQNAITFPQAYISVEQNFQELGCELYELFIAMHITNVFQKSQS